MEWVRLLARQSSAAGCTKETCPASASVYGYAPGFHVTVPFIVGFAISTLVFYHQNFIWPKWRFYSLVCAVGCLMEAGGYVGRLMLHNDPFSKMGFKINIILLTVAPAFISAGIYVTLKQLVLVFGPEYSRLSPNGYAYVFVCSDAVSIILQAAGGSISAVAKEQALLDQGVDIMIAGLVSQVFTLLVFALLCGEYAWRLRKNKDRLTSANLKLVGSRNFRLCIGAMVLAFLCIFIRCCYRVAELCNGWGSEIMRKEGEFVVFDSVMCTIAATVMNIIHPGHFFKEPVLYYVDEMGEQRRATMKGGQMEMMKGNRIEMQSPVEIPSTLSCPRCNCWQDRRSWI